jgi:signal transduction histidine kinase
VLPLPDDRILLRDGMTYEEIEHELKTPLASIRSLSEIMRDYPDLPEAQRQRFLEVMIHENERLARTVERLLSSTMLSRGC